MNEKETPGFIIDDLDDFHLLIKPEHEYRVRRELEAEVRHNDFRIFTFTKQRPWTTIQLEKNTYSLET
jgi:TFIIH basal transcription factor complex TTD-A subunit